RAPNGVLEDSFYQATGRPLWSASNIYAPTLVIAGQFDTWSFPEDREGLMRDLVHAPVKHSVLIPNATHFVLFEKPRFQFFEEIATFIKEWDGLRADLLWLRHCPGKRKREIQWSPPVKWDAVSAPLIRCGVSSVCADDDGGRVGQRRSGAPLRRQPQ